MIRSRSGCSITSTPPLCIDRRSSHSAAVAFFKSLDAHPRLLGPVDLWGAAATAAASHGAHGVASPARWSAEAHLVASDSPHGRP